MHYAGHAIVNDQVPSLSRLLLARDGASDDDGALFVSELAKVRLDGTKLVVLAACSTASGMVTNGRGIASIARPFLEAGAATVVATLWDVQDQSAASALSSSFIAMLPTWPAACQQRLALRAAAVNRTSGPDVTRPVPMGVGGVDRCSRARLTM